MDWEGGLIILHTIIVYVYLPRIPTNRDGATPGFHRTRLAINHQARSAVMSSVSRMEGELHPAKIVRPEAYIFMMHLDDSLQ